MREYHPADEMRTPVHFCVGQEAPPVGVCSVLKPQDYLFTGHRSHGWYLAKGGSMNKLFAELYGKATGTNGGRAGSQELSDESVNFFSGTILAGMLPIAAGCAMASQMRGDDAVTVVVFGDGAADEGVVYETMNFAALRHLPMVFICENNGYSVYSRQDKRQPFPSLGGISDRAQAFGVGSCLVPYSNSMDNLVTEAEFAYKSARRGVPRIIEIETYRLCTHVGPEDEDPEGYRSEEEVEKWRERDPLADLSSFDSEIIAQIDAEIGEAFRFAKESPFPPPWKLMADVFSPPFEHRLPIQEGKIPFKVQKEAIPGPY